MDVAADVSLFQRSDAWHAALLDRLRSGLGINEKGQYSAQSGSFAKGEDPMVDWLQSWIGVCASALAADHPKLPLAVDVPDRVNADAGSGAIASASVNFVEPNDDTATSGAFA